MHFLQIFYSLYLQEALGYPFLVLQRQCQVFCLHFNSLDFSLFFMVSKYCITDGAISKENRILSGQWV